MKWPLVWRSTLEQEIAFGAERQRHHAEQVGQLKASLAVADARADGSSRYAAELQERYDALVRATLRPQGVVVDAPPGSAPGPVAREPDELKALIGEVCGTDLRKRSMMLRQLAADRAAGRKPEDIKREIEHGIPSDGVPV